MDRQIPTGVKVIAVMLLISAPLNMISAIIAFGEIPGMVMIQALMAVLIIAVGISLLLGQNWARITAIVLSFITVINGTVALAAGQVYVIVNIVLNLVIAIYLMANKDVIQAFSSESGDFEGEYYDYEDQGEESEEIDEYDEDGFAEVFPGDDDDDGFTEVIPDEAEDEDVDEDIEDSLPRRLVFRVKGG